MYVLIGLCFSFLNERINQKEPVGVKLPGSLLAMLLTVRRQVEAFALACIEHKAKLQEKPCLINICLPAPAAALCNKCAATGCLGVVGGYMKEQYQQITATDIARSWPEAPGKR